MGLDMYLSRKYYVKNWDYMTDDEKHTISILKGGKPSSIPVDKICNIQTEEMYWRKANAIHNWFVKNVQDDNDDCGYYYVSREQLRDLLNTVTMVLDSSKLVKAKIVNGSALKDGVWEPIMEDGETLADATVANNLLPTQEGFFFGGTDYNQWYFRDLEYTKKELERLLSEDEGNECGNFEYHSSW